MNQPKKWRVAEWAKSESAHGGAAGSETTASSVRLADGSRVLLSTTDTSATAGTEQAASPTTTQSPKSSMSVELTSPTGQNSTAWIENPRRAVEEPWLCSAELLPLEVLEEGERNKLIELAGGRGEEVLDTIRAICDYYAANDHIVAECGTVYDAVVLYLQNEVL